MTVPSFDEWWERAGYRCRTIPADDGFWSGRPRGELVKIRDPACGCARLMDRGMYDDISEDSFRQMLDGHAEGCPKFQGAVNRLIDGWAPGADPE